MNQFEFMHYRSNDGSVHTGATVAILPIEKSSTALIAVARCAPGDIFNKKIGRDISSGRIRAYLEGRSAMIDYVREVAVPDVLKLKASVDAAISPKMKRIGLS